MVAAGIGASALVATAAPAPAKKSQKAGYIVLNGQGNDLDAYAPTPPFKHQTVIQTREKNPKGLDLNAQICFFGDGRTFIAGEDTGQPDPIQGWGIFRIKGSKVGKLKTKEIGKLQPTYQGSADNAENYGCGLLSDGRLVTTDIGNQAVGAGDGQLIVWFPPFDADFEKVEKGTLGKVSYCKIDIAIGVAGGISVDDQDNVYVASARGETAGVWKYQGNGFPTSNDASGGCGKKDGTGAPMADTVGKARFITTKDELATPNAIVPSTDGTWYVSSVLNGVINEYDTDGTFIRRILEAPAGEQVGPEPISTGTPLGLGVGPDGTIYFADIGLVADENGVGPGNGTGKVRRITFVDGEPQAPETMAEGLAFPDGIGIFVPPKKK
jgi:hypothetical protein